MGIGETDETSTPRGDPTPAKRPYRAPVLHAYGDLRAITGSVGSSGAMDGGTMAGMMMTR